MEVDAAHRDDRRILLSQQARHVPRIAKALGAAVEAAADASLREHVTETWAAL
jgi:hypothetical protein